MKTATACNATRRSRSSSASERGFTLIELLVAIAAGLFLTIAILVTQLQLTRHNSRTNDIGMRDTQARAGMAMLTDDLISAGFLNSGQEEPCYATLNYNTGLPNGGHYASYAVSAIRAQAGLALPFVAGNAVVLNYPPAGSAIRSDVLVIRAAPDGSRFPISVSRTAQVIKDATFSPSTTGIVPVNATTGFNAGDIGIVRVPVVTSAGHKHTVCARVPISAANVVGTTSTVSSGGNPLMPANAYSEFSARLPTIGLQASIGNGTFMSGAVTITDVGPPVPAPPPPPAAPLQPSQVYYVYYIVGAPTYQFPTLVRQTVNALDDTVIPGSLQQIAGGVVSLQVALGLSDPLTPPPRTAVVRYDTGWGATASFSNAYVRSAKVALVTRSLFDDPELKRGGAADWKVKVSDLDPSFSDVQIPASEEKRRFVLQSTEVGIRNELWAKENQEALP